MKTRQLRAGATRWMLMAFASILMFGSAAATHAADKLDEGMLDPEWFGGDMAFHTTDEIDYLWVKEGFSFDGKTVQVVDWEDPEFLRKKKRDSKDSARAFELTDRMPGMLRGALSNALDGKAEVSRDEGDLVLHGRYVDVNAGSKAAKWLVGMGAGSATATWDMKLVDASSGEVVVAIHHRAISGTNMSDIDDKIVKWLDEGLADAVQAGLGATYGSGKPAKE